MEKTKIYLNYLANDEKIRLKSDFDKFYGGGIVD